VLYFIPFWFKSVHILTNKHKYGYIYIALKFDSHLSDHTLECNFCHSSRTRYLSNTSANCRCVYQRKRKRTQCQVVQWPRLLYTIIVIYRERLVGTGYIISLFSCFVIYFLFRTKHKHNLFSTCNFITRVLRQLFIWILPCCSGYWVLFLYDPRNRRLWLNVVRVQWVYMMYAYNNIFNDLVLLFLQ